MITQEQIDSWLKEFEERPASGSLILQFIANRLRDLSARNEELLAENIALMSGKRVEEYEKRITHLEYQLDLLKRQLGGAVLAGQVSPTRISIDAEQLNLLVYDDQGSVLRLPVSSQMLAEGTQLARLSHFPGGGEALRLLLSSPTEELMFIFSSGRVETRPVSEISTASGEALSWLDATIPCEPNPLETLTCIAPLARMALVDFFVQTSRKGCLKKMGASMGQSILDKHYIGAGVRLNADRNFELNLCKKDERLVLVSHEGYLVVVEIANLSYSIDEVIKLAPGDHLVAAFRSLPGQSILVMTTPGKLVHLTDDTLDSTASLKTRGQSIFSQKRREAGVRVAGAGAAGPGGVTAALHQDGAISLQRVKALTNSGAIPTQSQVLGFAVYPTTSD